MNDDKKIKSQSDTFQSIIRNNEDEIVQQYHRDILIGKYTNFKQQIKKQLYEILGLQCFILDTNDGQKAILFYCNLIPNNLNLDTLYSYYIYNLNDFFEQCYQNKTKVHLVTFLKKKNGQQRKILNLIYKVRSQYPAKYYDCLQILYLINTGFRTRTSLKFNSLFFYQQGHLPYKIINLNDLKIINIIDSQILDQIQKDKLIQNEDSVVDLDVIQYQKKFLYEYQMNDNEVPSILIQLFNFFDLNPQHYTFEGIFRAAASINDLEIYQNKLYMDDFQGIQKCDDPRVISNLIKIFLRNLKEPIIPFQFFTQYVNLTQDFNEINDQIIQLNKLIQELSICNRNTLVFILEFLLKFSQYEQKNLMSKDNLALLITPCISWSLDSETMVDVINSKLMVKTSKLMFHYYDQVFNSIPSLPYLSSQYDDLE